MYSCSEITQSDWIELSNFDRATTDPKGDRFCGVWEKGKTKSFTSEGSYYRVTFHSNEVYDAMGFSATYEFKKKDGKNSRSFT